MGGLANEAVIAAWSAVVGAGVWTVTMMRDPAGDNLSAAGQLVGCIVGAWVLIRGGVALWRVARK